MTEKIVFYLLFAMVVFSAIMVISRRNLITAAVWLLAVFFGVAGVFAYLGAHFLAVMQILLYAGAILVLFVFVIMTLNPSPKQGHIRGLGVRPFVFGCAAIYLFVVMGMAVWFVKGAPMEDVLQQGTIESVGRILLTTYIIPFELSAVLVLVAIVGAVSLVKRGKQ